MKFWLPERLHTFKPLLLSLSAALLVRTSDDLFVMLFSVCLVCFALWMMCVRLMLLGVGVVKG